MEEIPGWLAAPLIAAVIAAVGYVGKLAVELRRSGRVQRAEDLTRLLALQTLLEANRLAFATQIDLVRQLAETLRANHSESELQYSGAERLFTALYDQFSDDEAEYTPLFEAIQNTRYALSIKR